MYHIYNYIYIYIYPPPRSARRREWEFFIFRLSSFVFVVVVWVFILVKSNLGLRTEPRLHDPASARPRIPPHQIGQRRLQTHFFPTFHVTFLASFLDASSRRLKCPPRRPKTAQDGHKTAQEPSKSRFWWIFEAKIHPSWHPVRIPEPSYVKIA